MDRSLWDPLASVRGEYTGGTWLGAGSALATAVILGVTVGTPGLVAGILLVVLWYLFPVTATFAVGQVIAIVLFPATLSIEQLVLVELGLNGMVLGAIYRYTVSKKMCGVATVSLIVFLGLIWLTQNWDVWLTAVVLLGSISLLLYSTHRYELVRLDLLKKPQSER